MAARDSSTDTIGRDDIWIDPSTRHWVSLYATSTSPTAYAAEFDGIPGSNTIAISENARQMIRVRQEMTNVAARSPQVDAIPWWRCIVDTSAPTCYPPPPPMLPFEGDCDARVFAKIKHLVDDFLPAVENWRRDHEAWVKEVEGTIRPPLPNDLATKPVLQRVNPATLPFDIYIGERWEPSTLWPSPPRQPYHTTRWLYLVPDRYAVWAMNMNEFGRKRWFATSNST